MKLFWIAVIAAIHILQADPPVTASPLTRIALGSCAKQDLPQPIWKSILRDKPDVFLFLGDNIYADTKDMDVMRAKYRKLSAIPEFKKFRDSIPIFPIWDDHDYGANDAGSEYPMRKESQQVFLDFWHEPPDSPRWKRAGVYDAKVYGPPGKRVQIILVDTRYFRSPLKRASSGTEFGPYVPDPDTSKTMLGAAQWQWLEEQLRVPAELRILGSGIEVIAEDHSFEKWANLPLERQRLFGLIRKTSAAGVVFISGDRHLAELSMMDGGVGYPLYDLTSSSLTHSAKGWRPYETNRHRVATMNWGNNYGFIAVDWNRPDPQVSLQIRDVDGDVMIQCKLLLSNLQPGTLPPG